MILRATLEDKGYDVVAAASGREALAMLVDVQIHLVISDWEMPDVDGLQLCRAVREHDSPGDTGRQRLRRSSRSKWARSAGDARRRADSSGDFRLGNAGRRRTSALSRRS